jgi:molybdopterin-containing oxidoreductase family iron-sulfur binding subunit
MIPDPLPGAEGQRGPRYWRGLEELALSPEFIEQLRREFPNGADQCSDPVTRRQFLMLMGASLALAGVSGCSPKPAPAQKIMPYVNQPEELLPGRPLFFATALTLQGLATGVIVESHEGRPTKVEGNPSHPASRGATDPYCQAAILSLYDPDRSQTVMYRGRPRTWSEAQSALRAALEKERAGGGGGLRILTESVTSPTLGQQLTELLARFPNARWYQYEPCGLHRIWGGARLAFNENLRPRYHFDKADVVLCLDYDFLSGIGTLGEVRSFMSRRRVRFKDNAAPAMNRLYAVESMVTCTGMKADHRLAVPSSQIGNLALALAGELQITGVPAGNLAPEHSRWVKALAHDLGSRHGKSVVAVGTDQPEWVHALGHAINQALGNIGSTVDLVPPAEVRLVDYMEDLKKLTEDMQAGRVTVLVIIGANPVYSAPCDLGFAEYLERVPLRLHLGFYQDETADRCDWHIPQMHSLETWSDARAADGTVSIIQPLIEPLYAGKSAQQIIGLLGDQPERADREIVQDYWRGHWPRQGNFVQQWEEALQLGIIAATGFSAKSPALQRDWARILAEAGAKRANQKPAPENLEISFRPDPTVFDGRFSNNGWLQELPKPVTKLTWENAVMMSPRTAEHCGIQYPSSDGFAPCRPGPNGGEHGQAIVDLVELTYQGRTTTAPVWLVPGHADNAVTLHLGYGRRRAGRVGNGLGFDANSIRRSTAPDFDVGAQIRQLGRSTTLACTQMHHWMQGRDPIHSATLADLRQNPRAAQTMAAAEHYKAEVAHHIPGQPPARKSEPERERELRPLTMYPPHPTSADYRWAMAIDLTACTGCSACVVACQAENNIPVVGKSEVVRGHEMHWLRIDRYFAGDDIDHPRAFVQPVPCMQCENAPCELVCPVAATAHSADGLNDMVYNRCVGTRYCSNNCPYKVRRFNFFQFSDYATESLKLGRNPNVTVRSRGVMEKCTYCVQRLRAADIGARTAGRSVHDGEVQTACQAACPAGAIMFGDLKDEQSQVAHWKSEPTEYALLAEQNTRPRTTYLAAVTNPNPELA